MFFKSYNTTNGITHTTTMDSYLPRVHEAVVEAVALVGVVYALALDALHHVAGLHDGEGAFGRGKVGLVADRHHNIVVRMGGGGRGLIMGS